MPFNLWQNAEASLAAVLEAARSNFKHELLTTNFVGIPILQQHGAEDDNVPAYHSRLMHQLIWEHGQLTQYHEILGAGHWFDGVLTTAPLQEFYNSHVRRSSSRELLKHFSITFPSSADMGSKGGILVDQLWSPDRFGRIDVDCDLKSRLWRLKTRNVRRFHITVGRVQCFHPKKIIVDGSELPFTASFDETNLTWYTQDLTRNWTVSQNGDWRSLSERYGRQVGTLDSILRTKGPLTVMSHSLESNRIASQISRSLFQYFAADINLVIAASAALNKSHVISAGSGNVITVTLGGQLSQSELSEFPIFVHGDYLKIRSPGGFPTVQYEFEPGLGAIFLRPLMDERLELVIWGADVEGLQQAARLVPTVTGVGQPDFVVLSARCRWKGANGAYAAGFLDYSWQVSSGSYLS